MSAPQGVDVLAVMDAAACPNRKRGCDGTQYQAYDPFGMERGVQCDWCAHRPEARAAVAELIAASAQVQEQFAALVRIHGEHTCWEMRDRLAAALTRIGSAK